MKTDIIHINDAAEYDRFVQKSRYGHFMQSSLWAKVKDDWQWFGVICREESGEIAGTMGVLVRKVAHTPYHMMYSPRGPVCEPERQDVFNALIDAAVREGKKFKAHELKIDKDISAGNEMWRRNIRGRNFNIIHFDGGFAGLQCTKVIRIDIENKTVDEVFSSFDSGHRRKIRVALKNNVQVEKHGSEVSQLFFEMMKETTERDGFALRQADYFKKIVDVFGDAAAIYIAYYTPEGGERTPIAGALSVEWGDKFWYFYGASRNIHREVMPNYLIQWTMIKQAVEDGCRIYDFRGVSRLSEDDGLYRFKIKFGAYSEEFMGEMSLDLKPLVTKAVRKINRIRKQ
ncbi:MAG: peptidoglycan bridge formation glycyltransferase FemA/FemB family protein [Clostridiales bacterium]|nr:peptidoglycan bridge formation glycyltransferase FemA/FemB family protein [Clostridiales bacterium]